jgi:ubiquinone/menaquinone biosynthesis C-methylase UbiE
MTSPTEATPSGGQYDDVAEDYDRLIRPRFDAVAALVVDLVRELTDPGGLDVVEISAGTGALTHQLAPLSATYVATDISEPMLAVARRHDAPGLRQVRWQIADMEDLPLEASSVDLVVSSLGPLLDSERALAEAQRVLRTGGLVAGVTWGDDYSELACLQEVRRRLDLPPRPTTSPADVAERLERAGFGDVVVRDARLPAAHASVAAYLDYRRAFGLIPDLTPADNERLMATLTECLTDYVDESGQVVLDWQLCVFSARS